MQWFNGPHPVRQKMLLEKHATHSSYDCDVTILTSEAGGRWEMASCGTCHIVFELECQHKNNIHTEFEANGDWLNWECLDCGIEIS